ncbi:MAG: HD domain-containing protein [Desulfomonile tiedjei]|nr:HD domain-containing protein [Desulfomonile tiedjei]
MGQINIPTARDCHDLLAKYNTPAHIVLHCRRVWEVGRVLGEGLLRQEYPVDMALLQASCLLHDIGKYPSILDRSKFHDIRGEQILEQEGFPDVANIVGQHVILRSKRGDPIREEHVVFYADKRVVHDEVVSLEDRFVYLFETYAKTPEAVDMLTLMKDDTVKLEREIFLLLDFGPDDLQDLLEAETLPRP